MHNIDSKDVMVKERKIINIGRVVEIPPVKWKGWRKD